MENVTVREQIPEVHYQEQTKTMPVEKTKVEYETVKREEKVNVVPEKEFNQNKM
jgi:hypothetical protein